MCKNGILILCVLALCLSLVQTVYAVQKPNHRATKKQYLNLEEEEEEETETEDSKEDDDDRDNSINSINTNDVGYIIVGESHVTLSERAVMKHNNIQECAAGKLTLGEDLFFIHTILSEGTLTMHNGGEDAYENLNRDKNNPTTYAGADPKWLHTDGVKDPQGNVEKLSALSRIKSIVEKHSDKNKWVVVIVQGYTIASSCWDNPVAYNKVLGDKSTFAKKLIEDLKNKQVKVFDMSVPYGESDVNKNKNVNEIKKLNTESVKFFKDKTEITFYNWSDSWTDENTWGVNGGNHLSVEGYYKLWKEHLGKEFGFNNNSATNIARTIDGNQSKENDQIDVISDFRFNTSSMTIKVKDLDNSYKIAWVSDTHIVANYISNQNEIKNGNSGIEPNDYIKTRYNLFVTDSNDSVHSVDLWNSIIDELNATDYDAVIFGGDLMDYYSEANYNVIKEGLSKLNKPWIYIYGSSEDHDAWTKLIGGGVVTSKVKNLNNLLNGNDSKIDLGGLVIVGIQNSADPNVSREIDIAGGEIEKTTKPVLLATHVPFDSNVGYVKNNLAEDISKSHYNQGYYWANGSYKWSLARNNVVKRFLETYIYDNSTNVIGVVAGHVHMIEWEGFLSSKIKQHIFPASYRGYIGVINIVPE